MGVDEEMRMGREWVPACHDCGWWGVDDDLAGDNNGSRTLCPRCLGGNVGRLWVEKGVVEAVSEAPDGFRKGSVHVLERTTERDEPLRRASDNVLHGAVHAMDEEADESERLNKAFAAVEAHDVDVRSVMIFGTDDERDKVLGDLRDFGGRMGTWPSR